MTLDDGNTLPKIEKLYGMSDRWINIGLEDLDSSPSFDLYFLCEHRKPENGTETHYSHLWNRNGSGNF